MADTKDSQRKIHTSEQLERAARRLAVAATRWNLSGIYDLGETKRLEFEVLKQAIRLAIRTGVYREIEDRIRKKGKRRRG